MEHDNVWNLKHFLIHMREDMEIDPHLSLGRW